METCKYPHKLDFSRSVPWHFCSCFCGMWMTSYPFSEVFKEAIATSISSSCSVEHHKLLLTNEACQEVLWNITIICRAVLRSVKPAVRSLSVFLEMVWWYVLFPITCLHFNWVNEKIYRVWVVYSRNYWILVLPMLSYIGTTGTWRNCMVIVL